MRPYPQCSHTEQCIIYILHSYMRRYVTVCKRVVGTIVLSFTVSQPSKLSRDSDHIHLLHLRCLWLWHTVPERARTPHGKHHIIITITFGEAPSAAEARAKEKQWQTQFPPPGAARLNASHCCIRLFLFGVSLTLCVCVCGVCRPTNIVH